MASLQDSFQWMVLTSWCSHTCIVPSYNEQDWLMSLIRCSGNGCMGLSRLGHKTYCSFYFFLWFLALEEASCHVMKTFRQSFKEVQPWVRMAQLNHFHISDLQKLCRIINVLCYFVLLTFGVICFTALDPWNSEEAKYQLFKACKFGGGLLSTRDVKILSKILKVML